MTPIPEFFAARLKQSGGIPFTPSNLAKQNYMYLKHAGARDGKVTAPYHLPLEDTYYLLYTYDGAGEIEYMDRRYTVGPGEGILIDLKQSCTHWCAKGADTWDFIWFVMSGSKFDIYYNQFAAARKPVFSVPEGSELAEHIDRLAKTSACKSSPQSEIIISTAIICILTQLVLNAGENTDDKRAVPAYIEGIMERINSDYESHITLDALAAEFNVSKFHLSREFKKYTGYSPNEYLISVRINHAKELLRRTGYSVGEISQMTGCGDVNHFIQLFKSREKTTPAAFRKHWQDS